MDDAYSSLAILVVFLIAAGVAIYLHDRAMKERAAAMAQAAAELNFTFTPVGNAMLRAIMLKFQLGRRGHTSKARNWLQGDFKNVHVHLFDHYYSIRKRKGKRTYSQSVLCFETPGYLFPRFSLQPETAGDKIATALGKQDIDFAEYPTFSARYLLRGDDEAAVRALFTYPVLEFLDKTAGIWVEGAETYLLFYRWRRMEKPEELKAFLTEGLKVLSLFYPSAPAV